MSTATIESLYAALARLDGAAMQACYAEGATFRDEAFDLRGAGQIGGMWRMLCDATRAKGADVWRVQASGIVMQGPVGHAHWEAHYRFSASGRLVHNIIDGTFTFDARQRILTHVDRFNFWRWSRQALGLPGLLLGWSPMLQNKVRARAAANLATYLAKTGSQAPR